jgi:hypothetical protein
MALLVDTFWTEIQERLVPAGWVITEGSRYDPTHILFITPSGRAGSLDIVDGVITVTVAGRSRSINIADRADWEPGGKSVDLLLAAHQLLPVNQR